MYVFSRFSFWHTPGGLKSAWVHRAPEAMWCGSVRGSHRLLQQRRIWSEAPSLELWRALCHCPSSAGAFGSCLVMTPDIHTFGHPPTIPVSFHGERPADCNPRTPACLDVRLTAQCRRWQEHGLDQVSAWLCYLLQAVNIPVCKQLQTGVRRMLQQWQEVIVTWCPLLGMILQYGGLRTCWNAYREAQTSTFSLWASENNIFFESRAC